MKEQFVTYEIALKLKELGFDEECLCTYVVKDRRFQRNPSNDMAGDEIEEPYTWKNSKIHESVMTAPLWQQAVKWLREKCDVDVWVAKYTKYGSKKMYIFHIFEQNPYNGFFDTYEEALEAGLYEALKLIKDEK